MSNIYTTYKAPNEGGLFLKFEDSKPVKVRITTEPYIFTSEFTDKATNETKISTKYAWGIWNYDEEKAQVLQLPVSGFRQVQELAQDPDWGDPESYDIKVMRSGQGLETKYSVTPNPNKTTLTDGAKEAIAAVDVAKAVKGVPLSQMVDEPAKSPKAVLPQFAPPTKESDDVVIQDLDDDSKVNLDDIPF